MGKSPAPLAMFADKPLEYVTYRSPLRVLPSAGACFTLIASGPHKGDSVTGKTCRDHCSSFVRSSMTTMQTPPSNPVEAPVDNRTPLSIMFNPRSVAVIGATENVGSVGRTVLQNLINTPFGGTVYPVNPKRPSVLGIKAYASTQAVQ